MVSSQKKVEPSKDDIKKIIEDKEKSNFSKKKEERRKSYSVVSLFFQLMEDCQGRFWKPLDIKFLNLEDPTMA